MTLLPHRRSTTLLDLSLLRLRLADALLEDLGVLILDEIRS